jgi:hypothetical protein
LPGCETEAAEHEAGDGAAERGRQSGDVYVVLAVWPSRLATHHRSDLGLILIVH